jgi:formylglycine-generating enzyme required for sulfatase activity
VDATGYITFAERPGKSSSDPPPGSACCKVAQSLDKLTDRWTFMEGANWKHPHGKNSSIEGKSSDPVVHLTFEDAMAYAKWAGKDLPTQDEWEVAARGGLVNKTYEWGDVLVESNHWKANVYQGEFPKNDTGEDGYKGISAVQSFSPNGYGLYDMTGNAWELTKDDAPVDAQSGQPCHWAKGGSFLCAPNYCARYRPTARIPLTIDTSTEHVGFRCVKHFK